MQNEEQDDQVARHPIRVVSDRTGLSPDLLRAWENRYQVVTPHRSDGGHRLYSDADVERLGLLRQVTSGGRSISQVAELPTRQLAELAREDEEARARVHGIERARPDSERAEQYRATALEAVRRLDQDRLDQTLRQAALNLGTVSYLQDVASPFLQRVGELWHEGSLRPAHEHLASVGVRRVLDWLINNSGRNNGRPRVVIGTPAGEHHEMGALLAAAAAESAGWEAIYLGPNLPADEIAQACVWTGARAVALSSVYAPQEASLQAEIREIRERLAPSVTLVLGGRAVAGLEKELRDLKIVQVSSIPDFIGLLSGLLEARDG
jgi:MerR family transcriptional regulator, light-induced transcriptional regulator